MKTSKSFATRVRFLETALFGLLIGGSVAQSGAQITNLTSQNSSLQLNLGGGVSDWLVEGVNQLNEQWFYYSIGSGPVNSIDTISSPSAPTISHGVSPTLRTTYANSQVSVQTQYTLQGQLPGTGLSSLGTTLTLSNPEGVSNTFHFYQYSDFGLGGSSANQSIQFLLGNPDQPQYTQTGPVGGLLGTLTTVVSGGLPLEPEVEAGLYSSSMLGLINGNPAPPFSNTLSAGPGHVVFGMEWDVTLAPGGSLQITEIQAVPEPSSLALGFLGLFACALLCWDRWFSRRTAFFGWIMRRTGLSQEKA
jgi:hypothetical protein